MDLESAHSEGIDHKNLKVVSIISKSVNQYRVFVNFPFQAHTLLFFFASLLLFFPYSFSLFFLSSLLLLLLFLLITLTFLDRVHVAFLYKSYHQTYSMNPNGSFRTIFIETRVIRMNIPHTLHTEKLVSKVNPSFSENMTSDDTFTCHDDG